MKKKDEIKVKNRKREKCLIIVLLREGNLEVNIKRDGGGLFQSTGLLFCPDSVKNTI